jgi:nitric oxide reductase NorQ protein
MSATATSLRPPVELVRSPIEDDGIVPEPSESFVLTPHVEHVVERALTYLSVGYSIHFSGPAGTGKTTLAFHVASLLGRQVVLIHGDDEFGTSDLVGRDVGYRRSKVVDNFIHSVLRTEENMTSMWVDNRLTSACRGGHTLIYDEFTRSRPEANNILLSILEERILNLPRTRTMGGEGYLAVHPDFRAIFTSNPSEYAGTHRSQDALMDRVITIDVGHYDRETEIQITVRKSGVAFSEAERVVDLVRELREIGVSSGRPTIRACIAIGKVLAFHHAKAKAADPVFRWVCRDILSPDTTKVTRGGQPIHSEVLEEVIQRICS